YELLERGTEPCVAVQLTYPDVPRPDKPIVFRGRTPVSDGEPGIGLIGAGAFASEVLVPALRKGGFRRFVSVASASGLSASRLAADAGFEKAVSGADAVIADPDVDLVVIATPHDSHALVVVKALQAGKHVFCEKPLAVTLDE